jgi:hypothetical protein
VEVSVSWERWSTSGDSMSILAADPSYFA